MQSTKIQVFPAEDDRGDWLVFIIILKEEQFLENYWFFSDWQVVDFATAVEEADGDQQLLFLHVLKPDIDEMEFQGSDLVALPVDYLEFSLVEQAVIKEIYES